MRVKQLAATILGVVVGIAAIYCSFLMLYKVIQ